MKIVDDFLAQDDFYELQLFMMGGEFYWHYNYAIDYLPPHGKVDENKFQFIHLFYIANAPSSPFLDRLKPIIEKIRVVINFNYFTRQ